MFGWFLVVYQIHYIDSLYRQKAKISLSCFMTEKIFESAFHKRYVGGEGEVVDKPIKVEVVNTTPETREEELLSLYRKYIGDPKAELPEEIRMALLPFQRTENGGKT